MGKLNGNDNIIGDDTEGFIEHSFKRAGKVETGKRPLNPCAVEPAEGKAFFNRRSKIRT